MARFRCLNRFRADTSGVARSDEHLVHLFLLLLAIVALAVFLNYTLLVLDGLPDVVLPLP